MNATMTLTDRYVDAAMRTVPEQLASRSRCRAAGVDRRPDRRPRRGRRTRADAAERAVLIELGDPDKLAAGYTDRPLLPDRPRLYLVWWRLLKLLLCDRACRCAVAGSRSASSSRRVVRRGHRLGDRGSAHGRHRYMLLLGRRWSSRSSSARMPGDRARRHSPEWSIDQLPEPRPSGRGCRRPDRHVARLPRARSGRRSCGICSIGFVPGRRRAAVVPRPRTLAVVDRRPVPPDGAGDACCRHRAVPHRPLDRPARDVNAVLIALAVAVPAIWLLSQNALLNPDVLPDPGARGRRRGLAQIVTILTGFGIAIIAVWDIVDGFLKATRA